MKQNRFIKFCREYFNLLLIFLILLFILRPSDRGYVYVVIWQICFIGVLLASIFNCNHPKCVKITCSSLAVPAIAFYMAGHFTKSHPFELVYLIFTFLFILVCVSSIISRVILTPKVSEATLRGVVSVYFMFAYGFAYLYMISNYLEPGSIMLLSGKGAYFDPGNMFLHNKVMSEMIYYSFVTLLTFGPGNVYAISDLGQTIEGLEGIIGNFYIAIFVTRLLAVYSLYADKGAKQREESPPSKISEN